MRVPSPFLSTAPTPFYYFSSLVTNLESMVVNPEDPRMFNSNITSPRYQLPVRQQWRD
ncbi:MAG: hypothetical protein ACK55Z_29860 [bacterium]